ncbi:hypothetical protein EDC04DRAFT_843543 [Pisolithus marmoratus]|nr:hypothetical protein EDC04DRAFT_843543 [Pisolithus marmoratus]
MCLADGVDKGMTSSQGDMRNPVTSASYFFAVDVIIAILDAKPPDEDNFRWNVDLQSEQRHGDGGEPKSRGMQGGGQGGTFYYVKPNYPVRWPRFGSVPTRHVPGLHFLACTCVPGTTDTEHTNSTVVKYAIRDLSSPVTSHNEDTAMDAFSRCPISTIPQDSGTRARLLSVPHCPSPSTHISDRYDHITHVVYWKDMRYQTQGDPDTRMGKGKSTLMPGWFSNVEGLG